MKIIIDAKVDKSDDIILTSEDVLLQLETLQNALDVAGRRIVGRADDSLFRDNLFAGLERYLFSKNIVASVYDIKSAVIKCLARDNLFASNEYDVKVVESSNPREAKLYIIFKTPLTGAVSTFRIFVDIENQRIYRG